MSAFNHIERWDVVRSRVTCECGAVYEITESDGIPGCREIEKVYCCYCGEELASHFGDCSGHLIDDSKVSDDLKRKRNE